MFELALVKSAQLRQLHPVRLTTHKIPRKKSIQLIDRSFLETYVMEISSEAYDQQC